MCMLLHRFDLFIKNHYKDFKFRQGQKEAIQAIIKSYEKDKDGVFLLSAPTGAGKSVIAMVFAHFMSHLHKDGYILASDLSLHKQYEEDFTRYNYSQFTSIKGVDNYICTVNGERFSTGECKNKSISYTEATKLPCYESCGYLVNRAKAISSSVTLLTYPYALIQRNYVEWIMGEDKAPFKKRDFVVCDEAHKLVDIVQGHFSPRVSYETHKRALRLMDELQLIGFSSCKIDPLAFKEMIDDLLESEDKKSLLSSLGRIEEVLKTIKDWGEDVRDQAKSMFKNATVPKPWRSALRGLDHFKDVHCKVQDYVNIVKKTGVDALIKNPQQQDNGVLFNCIDESYLMEKHFMSRFGFKILMTATMGNPKDFAESIGITKYDSLVMKSTFDYTKSPINLYPHRKMSYAHIESNMGWLVKKTTEIIRKHKGESGIIHSASYALTQRVHQMLPKDVRSRVIVYTGSIEKETGLNEMLSGSDKILMGPSLLEGLNLDEDKSRFQIFLKVPYPNMKDRYIEAKMKHSRKWYEYKTSMSILQGIGRSIRSEEDWAVTYFLDACMSDLITNSWENFPEEFLSRINIVEEKT